MANAKGLFSKTNIIIFGVVAAVILYAAGTFVRAKYFGAEIGASCNESSDCKGAGAWCTKTPDGTARFCTQRCMNDQACPAGWTCGDSGWTQAMKTGSGTTMGKTPVNVCWLPGKGKAPPMRSN